MIYLLFSILSSASLIILFKLFDKFGVKTSHAIVINYWVAAILSFSLDDSGLLTSEAIYQPWFLSALILGTLFIVSFNIIAISISKIGIAVTTVANKMSLIIPVIFSIFFLKDSINAIKIAGIFVALIAVYLTSKNENKSGIDSKYAAFPLIVFISSGFIDTFFKYNEEYTLGNNGLRPFLSWIFLTAGIIGFITLMVDSINKKPLPNFKALLGGIALGIPNYFSLYFLMKTISLPNIEGSVIFPVNNMSIVAVTALLGILLFKEKISRVNLYGIFLCIIAIGMIAFSEKMMFLF